MNGSFINLEVFYFVPFITLIDFSKSDHFQSVNQKEPEKQKELNFPFLKIERNDKQEDTQYHLTPHLKNKNKRNYMILIILLNRSQKCLNSA
ncbi:hypothetical protein BV924_17730 [Pectobacterium odoriferum]|uniref:Uncharacterized protein n=1 Tax=Pectobacterium odoriferum TaxID=78398 RepID=A0ABD6VM57_9GAMM|nr:hypothetical protein [Pectobacterium odoriferum]POD93118.1 hypothetical protein BVY06_17665 [Pectobacterium odoriferum]POE10337.1 hypothetical protein BV924_17730 [Pectobacterium odoriferum]POE24748.1 hypothetical protein BV926_17360 [Pectobacterium odoriferum]POE29557.1 hypothetical protein BV919_17810 [Pectobacterium odoriferum]POE38184.1 hypothetical protein BV920_18140 [Pectobacterium odoriferum]